jgi:hypothetical protein
MRKLAGCHFGAIGLIEAESQTMLNTLTERDFQDSFKKGQKLLGKQHTREGDYFKGYGGQ